MGRIFETRKHTMFARWDRMAKQFARIGKEITIAVKAGGSGDVSKTHVLWSKDKGLPYVSSAIHYRGQYVMVKDGGLLTAYDVKTGKEVYLQERAIAGGRYYASPVAANGHIYFATYDDGVITVSDTPGLTHLRAALAVRDSLLYLLAGAGHPSRS